MANHSDAADFFDWEYSDSCGMAILAVRIGTGETLIPQEISVTVKALVETALHKNVSTPFD